MLKTETITAAAIRAAMRKLYAQPEWAILFEVRDATGFNGTGRSADAVAMSLWPSRGLEVHGFEIKVSRSDWRREAAKPQKAETMASFCDRWWIVAPPEVVPREEVPPAWGHMTWDGKRWSTLRAAEKTEANPLTRQFLAALLRRAHKTDDAEVEAIVEQRDAERQANFERTVEERLKWRMREHSNLKEAVAKFQAASGVEIEHEWRAEEIGKAVKVVQAMGLVDGGAARMAASHEKAAQKIREALAALSPSVSRKVTPQEEGEKT